jgi:hypothetical protein
MGKPGSVIPDCKSAEPVAGKTALLRYDPIKINVLEISLVQHSYCQVVFFKEVGVVVPTHCYGILAMV